MGHRSVAMVFNMFEYNELRGSWRDRMNRAVPGILLPVAVFLLGASLAGAVTPLAPVPGPTPWTSGYETRQYRMDEALTKARLMDKGLGGIQETSEAVTANMANYDVHFYDLVLELDPVLRNLAGTVTTVAEVIGDPLATLDLNLNDNMAVTQVSTAGGVVSFAHTDDILTVTLDRTYLPGETVSVTVSYSGNPEGEYFGWASFGGHPLIWTLSEPYGARDWWPCKDLNTDKADSVDITVTVSDDLVVASNGIQDAPTIPMPGKKTYVWRERYPIVTYLVSLAIHPYMVLTDEYVSAQGDTMPLEYYIVPDRYNQAMAYSITPDMITAFAAAFGEYPFIDEKYGHAHFPWGGGMEHQTLTSLSYNIYTPGLIAHELAHQWFGDLTTCADFRHIWLNEGFATWAEAYWLEVSSGTAAYHAEMADARFLGGGTIFVENPVNSSVIFDYDLTYRKASWVPHMLRHMLGDAVFFDGLVQYLDIYGHGSPTTEQFQEVFENVSGRDLSAFFEQWIYGDYHPIYGLAWDTWPAGAGHQVSIRVEQTQTLGGLFTMPLDVRIHTAGGTVDFVIENSEQVQWYNFQVDHAVTSVELDPDEWVLRRSVIDHFSSPVRDEVPGTARLIGNAPNPFNPLTEIRFNLPREQAVRLAVFDVSGRLVKMLVDEVRSAGDHAIVWDGTDRSGRGMASGTYFARMTTGDTRVVRPMSLVR